MTEGSSGWLEFLKKFERGFIGLFGIAVAFLVLSIGLLFAVESETAASAINRINVIVLSIFVVIDGLLILACRYSEENSPEGLRDRIP